MVLISPDSEAGATLQFPGTWFIIFEVLKESSSWFHIQIVAGTPEIQKQTVFLEMLIKPVPTSLTIKPEKLILGFCCITQILLHIQTPMWLLETLIIFKLLSDASMTLVFRVSFSLLLHAIKTEEVNITLSETYDSPSQIKPQNPLTQISSLTDQSLMIQRQMKYLRCLVRP